MEPRRCTQGNALHGTGGVDLGHHTLCTYTVQGPQCTLWTWAHDAMSVWTHRSHKCTTWGWGLAREEAGHVGRTEGIQGISVPASQFFWETETVAKVTFIFKQKL